MLTRRNFIKLCACSVMTLSVGDSLFRIKGQASCYQIPVLLYHRVGYTTGGLTVSPEQFAADLSYLANRGYCSISLEQFKDFIQEKGTKLPEKSVLITFDDGYLDNYENAYPILKKYSMLGTFFVITGLLWDYPDRMKPQHIAEMVQGGMSFGSHTVSHQPLGNMSAEQIRSELQDSKTVLESITGQVVDVVAYPGGSYNQTVINIANELGYTAGMTVRTGQCYPDSPDYEIRRIPVFGYDGNVATALSRRGY